MDEQFLIVAPDGWTEFDYEALLNAGVINPGIKDIANNNFMITTTLQEAGVISAEAYVNEAKFIDDRFMWLKLG